MHIWFCWTRKRLPPVGYLPRMALVHCFLTFRVYPTAWKERGDWKNCQNDSASWIYNLWQCMTTQNRWSRQKVYTNIYHWSYRSYICKYYFPQKWRSSKIILIMMLEFPLIDLTFHVDMSHHKFLPPRAISIVFLSMVIVLLILTEIMVTLMLKHYTTTIFAQCKNTAGDMRYGDMNKLCRSEFDYFQRHCSEIECGIGMRWTGTWKGHNELAIIINAKFSMVPRLCRCSYM